MSGGGWHWTPRLEQSQRRWVWYRARKRPSWKRSPGIETARNRFSRWNAEISGRYKWERCSDVPGSHQVPEGAWTQQRFLERWPEVQWARRYWRDPSWIVTTSTRHEAGSEVEDIYLEVSKILDERAGTKAFNAEMRNDDFWREHDAKLREQSSSPEPPRPLTAVEKEVLNRIVLYLQRQQEMANAGRKRKRGAAAKDPDDVPAKCRGPCCGGTKEWGVKAEDGPGDRQPDGTREWYCYACKYILDL